MRFKYHKILLQVKFQQYKHAITTWWFLKKKLLVRFYREYPRRYLFYLGYGLVSGWLMTVVYYHYAYKLDSSAKIKRYTLPGDDFCNLSLEMSNGILQNLLNKNVTESEQEEMIKNYRKNRKSLLQHYNSENEMIKRNQK